MSKQKQKRAKANKNFLSVVAKNKGKAAHKQTAQYLRGPKNGGPTLAQRIERQKYKEAARERERSHSTSYYRYW